METNGARPRCCEDADMAVLLENIEFRTFKDEQARLQTVVNVHGENNADEDRELSAQPSASVSSDPRCYTALHRVFNVL